MRHSIFLALCATGAFTLSACDKTDEQDVDRAFQDVNVVDETNLNDVMLTVADPNEAVAYFQRATAGKPDRIDLSRGLAKSLVRFWYTSPLKSTTKRHKAPKATTGKRTQTSDILSVLLGCVLCLSV